MINLAADIHIPYIKINSDPEKNFTPKPYWNSSLSKLVAERRLALSTFRRNPTPFNFDKLQEKIRECQRSLRIARSKSFQDFCTSLDGTTSHTVLWKKMKWFKGCYVPRSGISKVKALGLLQSLAPDFVCTDDPRFHSNNPKIETQISRHELDNSLRTKDTSPGSDNISYSMLYNLPNNAKLILLRLYNSFFATGFVPRQWRNIT